MFARYTRRYRPPPRPRWLGGGSRYSPGRSSFDIWGGYRCVYGNCRRRRPRSRRNFWFRDREFFKPEVLPEEPKEEEPEEPEPPTEEVLKILHVEDVDFHVGENSRAHFTDKYDKLEERVNEEGETEPGELVIRRGQEFFLTLNMDRPYDKDKDDLRLVFKTGEKPLPNKGTEAVIKVRESAYASEPDTTSWRASVQNISGKDVKLSVYPPANCIIGVWDLAVQLVFKQKDGTDKVYEYDEPNNIFIILNPFCKDDTVYMEPRELLEEYVLNDQGAIWAGSSHYSHARPWFFGQFEEGILDITLQLLRRGHSLDVNRAMADPVAISRMLSKMVNAYHDGVLVGNWSGDYDGGTRPTLWSGSVAILEEHIRTKASVKYGQCWVFSGILTTVCRAIGLPCRSVTNFDSAHDTDATATIDKFVKVVDGEIEDLRTGSDSIWNFHVWNEAWMTRPDLPRGYDGWQAIDATPQEMSDGTYQCGPCPLAAIRKGQLWLPHDTTFVFAEVNANVVYYELIPGGIRVVKVDREKVGKKMSTKAPNGGSFAERLDVTNLYKPPDGSDDEKRVLDTVKRYIGNVGVYDDTLEEIEVFMDDLETVMVGSNFEFKANIHNLSRSVATVDISFKVKVTKYTGESLEDVKSMSRQGEKLLSGESKKFAIPIKVEDYLGKLHGESSMEVIVSGRVRETGESFIRVDEFSFEHPKVVVTPKGKTFAVDKPFDVLVEVENPLPVAMTQLKLRIEGPGLRDNGRLIELQHTSVPALGKFSEIVSLKPRKAGRKTIVASFDCLELPDITGQAEINVPKPAA